MRAKVMLSHYKIIHAHARTARLDASRSLTSPREPRSDSICRGKHMFLRRILTYITAYLQKTHKSWIQLEQLRHIRARFSKPHLEKCTYLYTALPRQSCKDHRNMPDSAMLRHVSACLRSCSRFYAWFAGRSSDRDVFLDERPC